jgi:hypothetical protein
LNDEVTILKISVAEPGSAISEAELIHFFQAKRFGAIGAGPAASLGAGPFVVE